VIISEQEEVAIRREGCWDMKQPAVRERRKAVGDGKSERRRKCGFGMKTYASNCVFRRAVFKSLRKCADQDASQPLRARS
jgi:hypothetical protein